VRRRQCNLARLLTITKANKELGNLTSSSLGKKTSDCVDFVLNVWDELGSVYLETIEFCIDQDLDETTRTIKTNITRLSSSHERKVCNDRAVNIIMPPIAHTKTSFASTKRIRKCLYKGREAKYRTFTRNPWSSK